jgi:hypothetical protein
VGIRCIGIVCSLFRKNTKNNCLKIDMPTGLFSRGHDFLVLALYCIRVTVFCHYMGFLGTTIAGKFIKYEHTFVTKCFDDKFF